MTDAAMAAVFVRRSAAAPARTSLRHPQPFVLSPLLDPVCDGLILRSAHAS